MVNIEVNLVVAAIQKRHLLFAVFKYAQLANNADSVVKSSTVYIFEVFEGLLCSVPIRRTNLLLCMCVEAKLAIFALAEPDHVCALFLAVVLRGQVMSAMHAGFQLGTTLLSEDLFLDCLRFKDLNAALNLVN